MTDSTLIRLHTSIESRLILQKSNKSSKRFSLKISSSIQNFFLPLFIKAKLTTNILMEVEGKENEHRNKEDKKGKKILTQRRVWIGLCMSERVNEKNRKQKKKENISHFYGTNQFVYTLLVNWFTMEKYSCIEVANGRIKLKNSSMRN